MERTNRMSKLDDLSNAMADAGVYDDYDENTGIGDNAESPDTDAAAVPIAEDATGHSPTPWEWDDDNYEIYTDSDGGHDIALLRGAGNRRNDANGRHIVACVNGHDRLTATVDWLSAGLYGISAGYHTGNEAEYAATVLKWTNGSTVGNNPVDTLVTANRALVEALEAAREWLAYSGDDTISNAPTRQIDAALALAKGGAQ